MEKILDKAAQSGGELLFRLMRSLAVVENDETRCCELTNGQGLALLALRSNGPVPMREVASALGVSAGTATRIVDNLVRDRLVERTMDAGDRRKVCLRPTAQGKRKIKELDVCYRRFWHGLFACIPEKQLPGILSALEVLVTASETTRRSCCGSP